MRIKRQESIRRYLCLGDMVIDTEKLSAFIKMLLSLRQRIEETKEECTVQTVYHKHGTGYQ